MSNKAIFLDRDDTLIDDPGYINDPDQVSLLNGAAEALTQLKNMGYLLVVVSNQSGVARGIVTEKVLTKIHKRLEDLLAAQKVFLDKIYYCPYHPEGVVQKYRKESNLRKPNPGMLTKAAGELDIDLDQSWAVGDNIRDVNAGFAAGCKTILVNHNPDLDCPKPSDPKPDYRAVNLKEVVNIIKKHNSSNHSTTKVVEPQQQTQIDQIGEDNMETMQAPEKIETQTDKIESDDSQQLLADILIQLKSMQRQEMFDEFSMPRLMCHVVQVVAIFCLFAGLYFVIDPEGKSDSVLISLSFAAVFQIMALTFYMMHSRK